MFGQKRESKWTHLKGVKADEAVQQIKSERPDLKVQVVPDRAMVTADHRMDRVRVFVDDNGFVASPPRIG